MLAVQERPEIISLSDEEIVKLYEKITNSYNNYLVHYNVNPVKTISLYDDHRNRRSNREIVAEMDGKTLQLVLLLKYKGCFLHRDVISAFVRSHLPSLAADQQPRHLGSQDGWNILNKGAHVPDTDERVPSGYHYLVSLESPNPKIVMTEMKRAGRLAARNFDQLKAAYSNCCATCGIKEGTIDIRNNHILVSLQQGHMDPSKQLTIENTIPQCQYCNQTYKDYFKFNQYGRVIAINNPIILLQSSPGIQEEMLQLLLEEHKKRNKR